MNLERGTQAVPTLNSSPLLGINRYYLCYRDFLESVLKKGQCKTTSMKIASMYLQLTDLESALIQGKGFQALKTLQALLKALKAFQLPKQDA